MNATYITNATVAKFITTHGLPNWYCMYAFEHAGSMVLSTDVDNGISKKAEFDFPVPSCFPARRASA